MLTRFSVRRDVFDMFLVLKRSLLKKDTFCCALKHNETHEAQQQEAPVAKPKASDTESFKLRMLRTIPQVQTEPKKGQLRGFRWSSVVFNLCCTASKR